MTRRRRCGSAPRQSRRPGRIVRPLCQDTWASQSTEAVSFYPAGWKERPTRPSREMKTTPSSRRHALPVVHQGGACFCRARKWLARKAQACVPRLRTSFSSSSQ
eukprot:scaffold205873_cov30-Tisochrysis_lutea.AAC.2